MAQPSTTPIRTLRHDGAAFDPESHAWWFDLQDDSSLTPVDPQSIAQLQAAATASPKSVAAALAVTPQALIGGSAGAESLAGTVADDLLEGFGGNDTMDGAGGNDTVYGGDVSSAIGSGDDSITTGAGNDVIYGQDGNDSILAGEGDDFVDAGDGNDTVWGHAGIDSLYGGAGADLLSAGLPIAGAVLVGGGLIDGGSGDDVISSREEDFVRVPYEPTVIKGTTLIGGDGNDQIEASGQDVRIYGDFVDPAQAITSGNDFIRSLGGDINSKSSIVAGAGNDTVESSNADRLTVDGGDGDDLITSLWDGQSTLIGGAGADSLSATFSNGDFGDPFRSQGVEMARLEGGSGNDNLRVDSMVDTTGGQTEIVLLGGDDDDSLTAQDSEADNDASRGMAHVTLDGGAGNDTLSVSGGIQVSMTGGAGSDTFKVTHEQFLTQRLGMRSYSNLDGSSTALTADPLQITDFQAGAGGDVLDVSAVLANAAIGFVSGSNPFSSGHLSAQQVGADTHIVFDPDGQGASASPPATLAVLQGVSVGRLVGANFLPSQYTNVNDAPLASNDSASGAEDGGALTGNVLSNDSDPDGDPLSVTGYSIAGVSGSFSAGQTASIAGVGSLVINANGAYSFTPLPNYNGSVPGVTYSASDGSLTGSATLTLTVTAVNDAPTAVNDSSSRAEDSGALAGNVLSNDSDVEGNSLSVTGYTIAGVSGSFSAGQTASIAGVGSLVINANGAYSFTPLPNYNGSVPGVTYTVSDGSLTGSATLALIVTPVNDAPLAINDSGVGPEDSLITGNVLTNDRDVDGNSLRLTGYTVAGLSGSFNPGQTASIAGVGSLAINADGSYAFTPAANYVGNAPLVTYTVSDGSVNSSATLTLTVTAVNDAPTAVNDIGSRAEDSGALTGNVLGNDSDLEGNSLTVTGFTVSGLSGSFSAGQTAVIAGVGSLTLGAGGAYSFTPTSNYNGSVPVVTYTVTDGSLSATATLALTVTAVNDAPLARNDGATGPEDNPITGNVLANDSDVEGSPLSVTGYAIAGVSGSFSAGQTAVIAGVGSLVINGDGAYNFIPLANYNGSVPGVTYTVTDGLLNSSATLTLSVSAGNDAPAAVDDSGSGVEDAGPITGNVLTNDSDLDGAPLSVTGYSISGVSGSFSAGQTAVIAGVGSLVINGDGAYRFTPLTNYNGSVPGVTYTVSDGSLTDNAALSLSVSAVNDNPVFVGPAPQPLTATSGQPLVIQSTTLMGGFVDPDVGDVLQVATASASVGSLVRNNDGTWTYTAPAGFTGAAALTAQITDLHGGAAQALLNVQVTGHVNLPPTLVQPMPDQQAAQDWAFHATLPAGMFTDADSAGFTLSAHLAGGAALPAWLTFDAASRSFSGTPGAAYASATRAPTALNIVVTATDTEGATAADAFVLTVNWTRNLTGTAGNDALNGSLANETLSGAAGNDTLVGNGGNDSLAGGAGNDSVVGGVGNDVLSGDAGTDTLVGGAGNDVLNGGAGGDSMAGGAGNDSYVVDSALDRVIELAGEGQDSVTSSVSYSLPAEVEALVLSASAVWGVGNTLANSLTGNAGANSLYGVNGNDTLIGLAGNDYLVGGTGNDALDGGAGNDTLTGGAGADLFLFNLAPNVRTNLDHITDFDGRFDGIALDDAIFTAFAGRSTLSAGMLRSGAGVTSAADANDFLIYNTSTGILYYDSNGSGAGGLTQLAVLDTRPLLAADDFIIV
ncbi:MAG TPA: Ig-like domain-containing protein [Burkholderiaceae bacterium]|nr:Ig-like domain-containing protein [Burkholderiaceae bacterium]HMY98286.1 Ig-like domain-containing protein [Burkholderiaceae bacterium]HNB42808.1 Ig-like domain-containing protein [Burkholderiaceae bacterium]